MGAGGFEPPPLSPRETHDTDSGGAESGANRPDSAPETAPDQPPLDVDLSRVVEAWPTLPEAIRRAVLAMVEAS